jgi:hypothetical protein
VSRRGRWLALGTVLVAALLGGRILVGLLADRWWAASLDPSFAAPVTRLHLIRLGVEAAAICVGAGWFTLHLVLVVRAVHRVEIPRYLGNLEFRETVRRRTLFGLAAGLGALLGLLAGLGAASAWQPLVLWLSGGVRYGLADPALGRDLGYFTVDLPALAWLQSFALRLGVIGVVATGAAYGLVGALRWNGGRLAISEQARRHLAVLLTLLALTLCWGHLLDPARWLGATASVHAGSLTWRMIGVGSTAMVGVALGTAAISAAWAWGIRPLLVASSWTVLIAAALVVRAILPSTSEPGAPLADAPTRRALDVVAWGLEELERPAVPAEPGRPGLWHPAAVAQAAGGDSGDPALVTPGVLDGPGSPRAAWFAVRTMGGAGVVALADDRVAAGGVALTFRDADTLAYPGTSAWAPLGAVHPGAWGPVGDSTFGTPLGGIVRRAAFAWALQRPSLLRSGAGEVRWRRTPVERLAALVPWVTWDRPGLVELEGEAWWVSAGLLPTPFFAGSTRAPLARGDAGGLEHGLVGLVRASDGRARVVLAPDAGRLSTRLGEFTAPLVEPAENLPPGLLAGLPYSPALFEAQALAVARGPWQAGRLSPPSLAGAMLLRDGAGRPYPAAVLEDSAGRRVQALLLGLVEEGRMRPVLVRIAQQAMPSPAALVARWSRFPVFEQLRDSAVGAGARLEAGPVRYQLRAGGLVAWQPQFAAGPGQRPALVWVSVATPDRLGAGRGVEEAWRNLGGLDAPLPLGLGGSRLDEARRWLARADSALRAGDWAGFGRAFEALRVTLGQAPGESRR